MWSKEDICNCINIEEKPAVPHSKNSVDCSLSDINWCSDTVSLLFLLLIQNGPKRPFINMLVRIYPATFRIWIKLLSLLLFFRNWPS